MEALAFSAPHSAPRVHCRPAARRARVSRSSPPLHVHPRLTGAARGSLAARAQQEQQELRVAVVGDLHLEPGPQMELFYDAQAQLKAALLCTSEGPESPPHEACVVQLGDLGAYSAQPGSQACFDLAKQFLSGFAPLPYSLVTGNHDLEGFDDFATDGENLEAWRNTFGQHHFWSKRVNGYLLVGLSTTRFREAPGSCHEVFIDAQQLAWFRSTLAAHRDTPTLVFTHAPPMGSGLRTLQAVHVKNRCAWLNHGEAEPQVFAAIAAVNPQLKAWFSGHFHLSHDYEDSVQTCGECTFVQVGVIGATSTKDGRRHSRLVKASAMGFDLYTVDHNAGGQLRLDVSRRFDGTRPVVVAPPKEQALQCDPAAGWLCALDACQLPDASAASAPASWLYTGVGELAVQDGVLIEYDSLTQAPLGVVILKIQPGCRVRLVDASGAVAEGPQAVAVEVVGPDGVTVEKRVQRGRNGRFYQTFQENKYKKWLRAQSAMATA